jgi:hypothetical protein
MQVSVSGATAFIADGDGGLVIADVSDPTAPTVVSTFRRDTAVIDVAASGSVAYFVDEQGLVILDAADPAPPSVVSTYPAPHPTAVAFEANRVVVSSEAELIVVDVSDAASPKRWTSVPDEDGDIVEVAVSDGVVYALARTGQLRLLDISQQGDPLLLGGHQMNCPAMPGGIALADGKVFIVGGIPEYDFGCFERLDVSDPASITVDHASVGGGNSAVAVSGERVVVTRDGAVLLLDMSVSALRLLVTSLPTNDGAFDVALSDCLAFVATGKEGLLIVAADLAQ